MKHVEYKNLSVHDEIRIFPHGKLELINIGGGTVGRFTLEPGWRWSNDVKPIARTEWRQAPHFLYQVSGRMHVAIEDGSDLILEQEAFRSCQQGAMARLSIKTRLYWLTGMERAIMRRSNKPEATVFVFKGYSKEHVIWYLKLTGYL